MIKRACIIIIGLLFIAVLAEGSPERQRGAAENRMAAAAQRFLDTLRPDLLDRATFDFDDDNRRDWHYTPRSRRGLPLKAMNDPERRAAHALLRSALSARGYLKAMTIVELEQVLRELAEAAGRSGDHRDRDLYFFTVFGEPGGGQPWGWRVEGHHLSLNFSFIDDQLIAVTPAFMGANPAEVRTGRRAGLRVLAAEEDLGFALLGSLDADQRAEAIIADRAPREIIMAPGRTADDLGEAVGLPSAQMTDSQRDMLRLLLAEYMGNLAADGSEDLWRAIIEAGGSDIRFAWAGSEDLDEPHYYRVHGPTFVIEFDNFQGGANHIHTVWRSFNNDFGDDVLRQHYEEHHSGGEH